MISYYDTHEKTIGNSGDFKITEETQQGFPYSGLYFGTLRGEQFEAPALIDFTESNGLCFLYNSEDGRQNANRCIERLAWRIAALVPSNLCDLVLFNGGYPGDSFNSHSLINPKLFDQREQKVFYDGTIDLFNKLLDEIYGSIVSRMSTIGCSNQGSLVELNKTEGKNASIKYQFIFLTDFPHRLDIKLLQKISQIIKAGPKAGIFVIFSWDMRELLAKDQFGGISIDPKTLLDGIMTIVPSNNRYMVKNTRHDDVFNRFKLELDNAPISNEDLKILSSFIDKQVELRSKVSVNLRDDILVPDKLWSQSSRYGLLIPIGKINSSDFQYFEISTKKNPDLAHALIGGGTGSGKSTFLHDIVINAAWLYSPDELQFILLDMKSVEFDIYKRLPHMQVLSGRSEKTYGANLLRYVTAEIDRRKKLFSETDSKDIESYNDGTHSVPRLLVIIDEFQNLFVQSGPIGDLRDANISKDIERSFNMILKEGRAFGIHLLLATQNASDIPSIQSFLQQIKLRTVLKLQSKGVFLMQDNQVRPDKLIKGEGIYNDNYGGADSNSFFKCAYYGDETTEHRDVIKQSIIPPLVNEAIRQYGPQPHHVQYCYSGGGNAKIVDNPNVATQVSLNFCHIYIGTPLDISNQDVLFDFLPTRRSNLLIAGVFSNYLHGLVSHIIRQVLTQSAPNSHVYVLSTDGDEHYSCLRESDSRVSFIPREELNEYLQRLCEIINNRKENPSNKGDRNVLIIEDIREFKEEITDQETRKALESVVIEGPRCGVHSILHTTRYDDFENVFQSIIGMFGNDGAIGADELIREFDVKIEMKGVDGYKIFSNGSSQSSPIEDYLANIQIADNGPITNLSIYKPL